MKTVEFLSHLRSLDIQVFIDRDREIHLTETRLRCNAPEGALTPELRAAIQERKAEIIAFLRVANRTTSYTPAPLVPIARNGTLPLSFAQQRLWFLDQLVPNNAFYNTPAAVRLTGSLDLAALEQTFNEIVRRHEALRTTFVMVQGQPVQAIASADPKGGIASSFTQSLLIIDLRELPPAEREQQMRSLTTQEAQRPFDLAKGPLLRVTLLRLDESEYVLLLILHHIISDGWSMGVLIREIAALYKAYLHPEDASHSSSTPNLQPPTPNLHPSPPQPSPFNLQPSTFNPQPPAFNLQPPTFNLPKLPIQYADFAHWQREWLQGDVLATQLAYWRQQLDGISILNLPTDRPRPAIQTYQGATQLLQLPKGLSQGLAALSQQEGVTLFMTLLAAFQTLLYRYTQQSDIAVGSAIANRNRSEIEGLIGFFVNSLVLRTNLSGNPTFRELLSQVREVALGAYAHQDLPFEKLVEELHPERKLNQNPLFQVVFALQNAPMAALELPGLTLSPLQFVDTGTTRFDLEFHLWECQQNGLGGDNSEGISGFVVYSTDLFDAARINRMLSHFQVLLEGIVANPAQRIADLPILSASERHQLLVAWNSTQLDYAKDRCIHQLFEAQVEQTPDAIALVFDDQQLTYRELNRRSNQLAHYLQKQGVGAEVLVGLCVERSLDLIVGMLGSLKAGGAYLPLDPTYPSERLSFMIEDAQVPVLLTQQQWVERIAATNSQLICLDQDWQIIAQEIEDNPVSNTTVNNLVYAIYTSGTTGKPKGVEIEHRGLLNLVIWHQQAFNISALDRATQVAGVAFDACGWEIWPYLSVGASIYFPNQEIRRSPEKLQDYLASNAITISFLSTPLVEKFLLSNGSNHPALRLLLTGGDKLYQYPSASNHFQLVNNYGPTENTVVTTSSYVPVKTPTHLPPSIGRPIANTQVYILDQHLKPVPIGIPGELYISGDGLARGYLNRPELTAERFISNPFSHKPEARLYKTGDLVRYQPDGNIEFLGRIDNQVKIRGYRIELREIESVLSQHPAVLQTVVITRENVRGEKHLVAYVALNTEYEQLNIAGSPSKTQPANLQPITPNQLQDEQVLQWQMLYNETYQQPTIDSDPTFNIVGWNSSYTNQPIPSEQMREWVNNQVIQILALQPKRVLEIGCGTGLLLFRIAPQSTKYWGMDFSPPSLNYIRQQLAKQELPQVTLLQRMATDFEGVEVGAFDTVILNSVVQYFPSIDYLVRVIEGAVKVLAPGGFIFIGDVRSLPLLQAFHASVQLDQAEPALTREQLQQRVQMQMFQETELIIDPAFFIALKQHFSQICHVQIQLIRGRHVNELTQFRYNAILYIGAAINSSHPAYQGGSKGLDWCRDKLVIATVRQMLVENQLETLAITNIPNARVMAAVKTAEWLSGVAEFKTASQMREALQKLPHQGVDPEDFWALANELPYRVDISWSDGSTEGQYDVVFVRCQNGEPGETESQRATIPPSAVVQQQERVRPWCAYANNPLQAKAARQLVPQLQTYLVQELPEYMVPSAFVVLDALPLTPNGKVDYRALPTPEPVNLELAGGYVAPRTPVEEVLVKIFAEVLGVKQIGIHDNFFELGGHSLLATQLASRVRDAFGVELPLRSIFEAPAIANLSQLVESFQNSKAQTKAPALVPISRESRRMKLSSLNPDNPETKG